MSRAKVQEQDTTTTERKHCPYCGIAHGRRARACSQWCERRIAGHKSSVTGGRTRAMKRIMRTIQKRERHRGKWRQVAMAADPSQLVLAIFGKTPAVVDTQRMNGSAPIDR